MRIACLQFAPQLGDVENNLNRADAVLSRANPKDLDLLVLPELAFSGYNFTSLQHISPYLEPTVAGITSLWARTTALKYKCFVTVGYPEKVDVTPKWPASLEYYNSAITVSPEGKTIANYRKSFLYYTDETWALEGAEGFYGNKIEGLGNVAMGICMDLNPYKFEAPWHAWEFAHHVLHREANLVIMSMAWLTREDARSFSRLPKEPDLETLSYWIARLEPVIRADVVGEIIVVIANRTGTENEAVYAGTSTVLGICNGEVCVYGILGRGEKDLLVVDTDDLPQARLVTDASSFSAQVQGEPTQVETQHAEPSIASERMASDAGAFSRATLPSLDTMATVPTTGSASTTSSARSDQIFSPVDAVETPLTACNQASPGAIIDLYADPVARIRGDTPLRESVEEILRSPLVNRTPDPIERPDAPKSQRASRDNSRTRADPLGRIRSPPLTEQTLAMTMDFSPNALPEEEEAEANGLGTMSTVSAAPQHGAPSDSGPVPASETELSGALRVAPTPDPSIPVLRSAADFTATNASESAPQPPRRRQTPALPPERRGPSTPPPSLPSEKALPPLPTTSRPEEAPVKSVPMADSRSKSSARAAHNGSSSTSTTTTRTRSRSSSPARHRAAAAYSLFPSQRTRQVPPVPPLPSSVSGKLAKPVQADHHGEMAARVGHEQHGNRGRRIECASGTDMSVLAALDARRGSF